MADSDELQADDELFRASVALRPDELKRIDVAASLVTRGNRSLFMGRASVAAANEVLEREGIKVA